MSSRDKDPMEKKAIPSESCSDEEVEKTEENLEHLQIKEGLEKKTKEESVEPKQLGSPDQDGTLIGSHDVPNDPMPGPSGLQTPHPESPDGRSDKDSNKKDASTEAQDKPLRTKRTVPGVVTERAAPESAVFSKRSAKTMPLPKFVESRLLKQMQRFDTASYRKFGERSSSPSTELDSQDTLFGVPDIRTEFADSSTDGSVYRDAPENFKKDQSSSYTSALETLSTESSGANASELEEDSLPSWCATPSTATAGQGYGAYLALQLESYSVGPPTDPRYYGVDDISCPPNPRVAEREVSIDESSSEGQRLGDMKRLFQAEARNEDENPESSSGAEAMEEDAAGGLLQLKSDREMAAPHDRRKNLALLSSDSSSTEQEPPMRLLRSRPKPDLARKAKIANKSSLPLGSSSESNEPKSSSSDGSHPKEQSSDIKSSSDAQKESSHSESARKEWQKPKRLRNMQRSATSSKESEINEEEVLVDTSKGNKPEMIEATETSPGKLEDVPTSSKSLKLKSSDQEMSSVTKVLEPESSSMEKGLSFEAEPKRSIGKSKRNVAKLSTSPPSDEKASSTSPKAATNRPTKKSRKDQKPKRTRRRSGDSLKERGHESSPSSPDNSDDLPEEGETEL